MTGGWQGDILPRRRSSRCPSAGESSGCRRRPSRRRVGRTRA